MVEWPWDVTVSHRPFCQRAYASSCSFKFQRYPALPVPHAGEAFSVYVWLVSWPWLRTPLQLDSALLGLLSQLPHIVAGKKTTDLEF